ncbi:Nnf1-domain-containing protein [Emericellopsis atlantica]|uniref:Nnf1-domain-containing protein n=1 Tax=Emericellopsis atlantica TaxID=2614577 RepID=A0A9P7ZS23_9HYPO|nr:Nnf1-domain-containing protein [Emericellopsis atlantica]KAG9257269.1 Nnf1-domain-containing protein [Emericellopsis atlantica]
MEQPPEQLPPPDNDTLEEVSHQPTPNAQQPPPTPGARATRFTDLYAQALNHTLSKISYDNFRSCYPTIPESILRQVQAQMVGKLGDKCRKEFDSIMENRNVVARLNELETLVGDATERKNQGEEAGVQPHLLPPERILQAHLTPALQAHQSQLNARLQTTQSQNAQLHAEVLDQHAEIEDLLTKLEAVTGDVKGANAALAEVVEALSQEAREGRALVDGTSV